MDVNLILKAREEKIELINNLSKTYNVVSLKANIPGENKRINEAYLLISYFDKLINKDWIDRFFIDKEDGPTILYLYPKNLNLKEEMIKLEEEYDLGRFVDIDVFINGNKSVSRGNLRKCYLCKNPAFVCGRTKAHSIMELTNYIKENINKYLTKLMYESLDEAIMAELNIHPKFGLVTPFTNGSHTDMNYQMMKDSKNAIIDYLVKMFWVGYLEQDLDYIFSEIRQIGIKAEQAMFNITNGVNTYKGLIFDLGLCVTAVGYKLSNLNSDLSIYDYIRLMSKNILDDLKVETNTFGYFAYKEYGILGARGEAHSGFLNVEEVLKRYDLNTLESMYEALAYLISHSEDTILLKRCKNLRKYEKIREMFNNFMYNSNVVEEFDSICKNENLSFGGSADLLIVAYFINSINKIFTFRL